MDLWDCSCHGIILVLNGCQSHLLNLNVLNSSEIEQLALTRRRMMHQLSFGASITSLKIVQPCDTISQAFLNRSAGSNLAGGSEADLLEHQTS